MPTPVRVHWAYRVRGSVRVTSASLSYLSPVPLANVFQPAKAWFALRNVFAGSAKDEQGFVDIEIVAFDYLFKRLHACQYLLFHGFGTPLSNS